ncbi:diacylglycerol kinase [Leucobacter sp. OLJS4]|uniref:diacylglycerol/lipid kinase family protein n=1 Tax=unclassified Leucobacter TaxID=2621730 RepID=UPI000C18F0F7|nr:MULTISPECIES: diacylglycerol kinase family protein [unclassified Leucobacter]PII85846.1 diacylglycerol kinase [Leucobacter sp. OLCALW19]PII92919.1 diacylglycerol kinase [Leucobacter sp. OLAS13]PII96466.1 diacylglycerol kinase [Leucobacter sp. OLTLW20]PII96518.1 diacylglycerol kinase [Leucobacter sp. OLCS4]PII96696.1 diacylglycerol kinase [Leucobacter sp. OLDS2]
MTRTPARTQPAAAVVYQPFKTDIVALRREVGRREAEAGWAPTRWYETDAEDAGVAATRQAIADGASVVLGSGGDGTIRAISEALRGTGVPLAVIPQGTGNLLARNLGIPLNDLGAAVRAAFRGTNRPIDLGVMTIIRQDESEDEHVFLVLAGMGLDARAIRSTSSSLKKRVGWLAYVDAGLRTMIRESPLQILYSVDGKASKSLSVYTVMIGNCGLMPGGVLLIPDAQIDDGRLDVVALRPLGPFSWLRIWNKIGWENGVLRKTKAGRRIIDLVHDTRSVSYLRAKQYALSVRSPEPIQLDGDDFGLALAASGAVDPGALIVRVLPGWSVPALER